MKKLPLSVIAGATLVLLSLSGCAKNDTEAHIHTLKVSITDTSCDVSADTAPGGAIQFTATNSGTKVNEFEILTSDKKRLAGEKENIAPNSTATYIVQLSPGTYYTACRAGMTGDRVDVAKFTVGAQKQTIKRSKGETKAIDQAVKYYTGYVKEQSKQLLENTKRFAKAYQDGDDDHARVLYAQTHMFYERIEPVAKSFGALDSSLDAQESEASDAKSWTGWHRIEKDLWPPKGYKTSSKAERKELANKLVQDTLELRGLTSSPDFTLTVDVISNGASAHMDEIAANMLDGKSEPYSHTDLWDVRASVDGAKTGYGIVHDIITSRGDDGQKLASQIDKDFVEIDKLLTSYQKGGGYLLYDDLSKEQVNKLSKAIKAVSKPLNDITALVMQ